MKLKDENQTGKITGQHSPDKSLARNLHVLFIHQNFNSSSPSIERSTLQKVREFFRRQQFGIY
jgi:hypothetical protein